MTGAGAPGAPGILKCLRQDERLKIILADANDSAVGRYLHPDFVKILPASHPQYIPDLLALCRKEGIEIILPLVTRELFPLSENKNLFLEHGIKILVSDFEQLSIANNKSKVYLFLSENGIEVPPFKVASTVSEFKQGLIDLGYPEKNICFKPSVSNGSRGFRIINDQIDKLDLLFNYKPTSTYIGYEEIIKILSSGSFPELLISEVLPGDEFSVDCLANHGETVIAVPRIRKKIIGGISVEGEFINEQEIIKYCSRIIKTIKLHGNIGIQVKCSKHKKYLILEINPRVQGTIVAAYGAGVNLPVLAVKQELGLEISEQELQVKWGTRFSRYWNEVYY
jgi:carbamoyl-phosphate synthase large subunit